MTVIGGANITGTIAATQVLTVSGTNAQNTTVSLQGNVVNNGTIVETSTGGGFANIELNSFSLTNNGSFQVQAGSGGTRFVEGAGTFTNAASGTMTVDQALASNGVTAVVNQGSLTLTQQWTVPGSFTLGAGTVTATGGGEVVSSGTTTVGNGATSGNPLLVTGGNLQFTGTGAAAVTVVGGANLTGTIPVGASLTVSGTSSQNTTVTLQGNVVNNGTIVETSTGGGFAAINGNGNTLTNNGLFSVVAGAGGTRFLSGAMVNNGVLSLGAGETLNGNGSPFTQSATGQLRSEVAGAGNFGQFVGIGTATLDGVVGVDGGATVATGTTFSVLGYSSRSGAFTTRDFGTQGYGITYNATSLVLTALVPGNATATLGASTSFVVGGQPVTFTATISATPPAAGTPTGSVQFRDGVTVIATQALDGSGQSVLTTSSLAAGAHSITVRYLGDDNFSPADSSAAPVTVSAGNSASVVVVAAPTTIVEGNSVTFSATVSGGAGVPSGSVSFFDSAVPLGTQPLDGTGHASLPVGGLTAATHTITATYTGDAAYAPAVSPGLAFTVTPPVSPTTATFTVDANPVATGNVLHVDATVSASAGTPTGSLEVRDGSTVLATQALDGAGATTFSLGGLVDGAHSISVAYLGAPAFAPSTSPVLVVNVAPPPAAPGPGQTAIMLRGPLAPLLPGDRATFEATLLFGGSTLPTGNVDFADGSTPLGSIPLDAAGKASFTTLPLDVPSTEPVGTATGAAVATTGDVQAQVADLSIVASYPGDVNYTGSSTSPFPLTVGGTGPPPPPPPPPLRRHRPRPPPRRPPRRLPSPRPRHHRAGDSRRRRSRRRDRRDGRSRRDATGGRHRRGQRHGPCEHVDHGAGQPVLA
ncbi:MAG: Ig-like domain repeat protein [Acidimicrobiia bacterium]